METHVRNVGLLMLYLGLAMGVISIGVLFSAGGISGLLMMNDPFYKRNDLASIPVERVLAAAVLFFSMAMASPVAISGWGILRLRPWARVAGMIVAALNMALFPIGTAVGVYALWVLNDEATEYLFENAPAGGRR